MKKLINYIVIILTIFFIIEFLLNRELIFSTVNFSLNTWVNSIIPSLFPFFILSDILISYNFSSYLPKHLINLFKYLFNVKKEAILVFFLSIISGFPSNAKNTRKLYDMHILTSKEASHLLMFTHFSNPLFILGTVSILFFNNKEIGIPILISHYLSNIIVGIIFRPKEKVTDSNTNNNITTNLNFGTVLTNAIKSSIDTLLLIAGTLTCFLIISAIIINRLNLNIFSSTIIKSILEITMGLKNLSMLNLNTNTQIILTSMILSFGGLSVHMQVKSQLVGTDISYIPFLIGRIAQTIISSLIAILLCI